MHRFLHDVTLACSLTPITPTLSLTLTLLGPAFVLSKGPQLATTALVETHTSHFAQLQTEYSSA